MQGAQCICIGAGSLLPLMCRLCALLDLQVHSAVLAGSKKEVVIKVLRPGTEDVLLTDLNFVSVHLLNSKRGVMHTAWDSLYGWAN